MLALKQWCRHDVIAMLDQFGKDRFALIRLGVEGNAALIAVQHREVEAVDVGNILQLSPRRVTDARPFDLQHVRPEPSQ